jgi:two-component system, cell cycle sensor histidine kinase and response regulator CckA
MSLRQDEPSAEGRTEESQGAEFGEFESKLRSVFRATPIGITFSTGRVIGAANEAMCELTGYAEDELLGKSARMLFDSEAEFEKVGRVLYGPLPSAGRTTTETRYRRKDGATLFVTINAALIDPRDPDAGFVVTVQDITSRKRDEEALRTSEDRFRGIVEQSPFSIQVLSAQGGIIVVNEAFCALWGVTRESLAGYSIMADERLEALGLMPVVREAFAGERVRTPVVEFDVPSPHGESVKRVVQVVFYPLKDEAGALQSVVVVHLDFTERARAEEERNRLQAQLQQAMKMEAIGRLAGGIAHDFNNLLTSISGNAELAQMDAAAGKPSLEYLNEISKAVGSAASLTRQLLAFSRRQVIEPQVVKLNDLVERLERMLVRIIGEDIVLRTSLSPDLGSVRIDPGQFEQVLVNLAVNARDAMPRGGRLIIETSNIELDDGYVAVHPQSRPGNYVLLALSDTGHGMTEAVRQRLFEPFFTTKPQGKGTGLGLATIFGIVKQANGSIEVYSEVGQGTSFRIYLPRVDEAPQPLQYETQAATLRGGTETILIAEDNESVLAFARTLLGKLGYHVLWASDARAALQVAESYRERIDLLITDVVMPGMNGRELSERVVVIHPETKVLFTSGYAEDVIAHHGFLEKNLQFIGKPYSLPSLSAKIRAILDGSPWV